MGSVRRLVLGLLVALAPVPALTIIDSMISVVGVNGTGQTVYRYSYDFSQVHLLLNQELLIGFDAAQFQALSNSVAAGNFDLLLFQPNNPVGSAGGYSLLALQDNPSMAGPFSVDVVMVGSAIPSIHLPFAINQLNAQGGIVGQLESGLTGVPEPGTVSLWLVGSILALAGGRGAARRLRS